MSSLLIVVVTILYAWTSIALLIEGKPAMSAVFFGYAVANIGMICAL